MAALASVDAVVLFEEDTPLELIRALKPNVLVKGGDYTLQTVVGHEEVMAQGGRVEIVPTVEGFSTTNLVKRLTAAPADRLPGQEGGNALIIVTGGAGFIGSNLIQELNGIGERDILVVGQSCARASSFRSEVFEPLGGGLCGLHG